MRRSVCNQNVVARPCDPEDMGSTSANPGKIALEAFRAAIA